MASKNSADQHLQNILECTRGILFLGTPHSGSGFARWAELLAISIGFIKQTNAKILEVLKSDSEVLARIQTEFHTMIRDRTNKGQQPISITCFYEELPLPGVGEVSIKTCALFYMSLISVFFTLISMDILVITFELPTLRIMLMLLDIGGPNELSYFTCLYIDRNS